MRVKRFSQLTDFFRITLFSMLLYIVVGLLSVTVDVSYNLNFIDLLMRNWQEFYKTQFCNFLTASRLIVQKFMICTISRTLSRAYSLLESIQTFPFPCIYLKFYFVIKKSAPNFIKVKQFLHIFILKRRKRRNIRERVNERKFLFLILT